MKVSFTQRKRKTFFIYKIYVGRFYRLLNSEVWVEVGTVPSWVRITTIEQLLANITPK